MLVPSPVTFTRILPSRLKEASGGVLSTYKGGEQSCNVFCTDKPIYMYMHSIIILNKARVTCILHKPI